MRESKAKLSGDVQESFNSSLLVIREHHYAIDRLMKDLRHFEGELDRQLVKSNQIIEMPIRRLIAVARDILSLCRKNGNAEYVSYCLAAVDYLVNAEDAVPDFEHYDGFEDDEAVFRYVIAQFSLPIQIPGKVA
jgi:uncharacterized membrane protein YkvA (DUF1232 family)